MIEFINALWSTVTALAPSLILGLLLAGLLHVFVKKERVLSHLGKPGFKSSAKAALAGVPLPLCSCGVLPAALGLRRDGASRGAVTSFLLSTPQTGVDSIAVTWSILGWPIALSKVIAAFVAGLLGGTIADRIGNGSENQGKAPVCTDIETGSLPRRIWNYSFSGMEVKTREKHRYVPILKPVRFLAGSGITRSTAFSGISTDGLSSE